MAPELPSLRHVLSTEVQLGCEGVVATTMQRQVCGGVRTLLAERLSMVELEVMCFLTALTTFVDKRAARAVALVNCPAYSRGNVTTEPAFGEHRRGTASASTCVRRRFRRESAPHR